MSNKKLLMVAYYFPPFSEVGAVRIAKFAKYLHLSDWDLTVLTVKEKYYQTSGESYTQDVAGIKTIRTARMPIVIPVIREEGVYWTPVLFFSLLKQMVFNRPKSVYFTGGPFYHWVLAPFVRLFAVNYVLDFRDPWKLSPYVVRKEGLFGKVTASVESLIEWVAIKFASRVVNVTEQATQMYKTEYPQFKDKFITITNGFDPDDFTDIEPLNISRFDIVYSGKFGTFRDVKPFLAAFKKLIEQLRLSPDDIRFVWIGKAEAHIVQIIDAMNIGTYVTMPGFLPYQENLRYIKGSKISMLIAGEHPYEPTTKIFDYMALQQNILGITDADGFVTETLKTYPLGSIAKNNTAMIYKKLVKCFNTVVTDKMLDKKDLIKFDRSSLTCEMENLIEKSTYA